MARRRGKLNSIMYYPVMYFIHSIFFLKYYNSTVCYILNTLIPGIRYSTGSATTGLVLYIPSLLTDFKISNFVTFSYSGSMKDNRDLFYFKAKNTFPDLQTKLTVNFCQQCTQLKLALVPVSVQNLGKSYRAIFEKTPYMYRFNFPPQYGGTSEELRENIFSRKYLRFFCRISSVLNIFTPKFR